MAGRAAVLQLWPMSTDETPKVNPLRGGYPKVLARPAAASLWYSSYMQTYLERHVARCDMRGSRSRCVGASVRPGSAELEGCRSQSRNANVTSEWPEMTATYCLPSTA